jgi:hypothetical protein
MNGYEIARVAADRVHGRMMAVREAERACAPFMAGLNSNLAFDSAESLYRQVLSDACGIRASDVKDLPLAGLKILLKHQSVPGLQASRGPAMAFDASQDDGKLSSILSGVEPPKNLSTRSDFR